MKPRPTISAFPIGMRQIASRNLQCRHNLHTRAIAPALSYHTWHDRSRIPLQIRGNDSRGWNAQSRCYASTSATPTSKSQYGREPPPPAKTSKPSVPAKIKYSSKLTPPAKLSAAPNKQTAQVPAKTTISTETPVAVANEKLNPPPFTYAPDLALPARAHDQSFISHMWKTGRAYLTFYKTGVSHVRQTAKLAKSLRAKAAKTPDQDTTAVLTRAEWQVVTRSRKDLLRLPAFGLILLVFGEWTPLLVMYLTPIIPEACRIPSQVAKAQGKSEKKRQERLRRARAGIRTIDPLRLTLYEFSARYDCHSRIWDLVHFTPPKFLLQRNVRKKIEFLRKDDELVQRDGGYTGLERREVERACVERGIDVLGKKEEELRRALAGWYKGMGK